MLNVMRKHATGWVVKVLFGILILSFAIWGIGDVLRAPSLGGGGLASVAGQEIGQQEVLREFDTRYQHLQQQAGGALTRHQAVSFGLLNQALEVTVARHLVDAHARDMKLAVAEPELAQQVRDNPMFRGSQGFDRQAFEMFLRRIGTNEQGYLANLKQDVMRSRLVDGLTAPVAAPGLLSDRLLAYREEQRRGRALVVKADEIQVEAPDEATLKTYLEANAKKYEAPEYRAVTLVVLGPDDLAGDIAIDEATLRAEYESRIGDYRTPATRSFEQLVADQEAVVREAAEMGAAGRGFEQIAGALKGKGIERTELGPVRKGDLPEALDQTVFATEQGTTAAPVSSAFGWHLIKVTQVTPEATRSFADVRGDLEQELKMQRASEQLPDFANKLDDEIAAGTSLDEAASRLGLQALKIDAVDRQGQNRKQEAVAADRLTPEILGMVFNAGQGEPSLLNHAQNGSFYMFRVDSIDPARPRTLEEVRDVLSTAWKKEQQAERAKARAEELRAKVTDATALDAVAAAVQGVQKIDVGPLKRDDQGYLFTLTPDAVKLMFETPAGATVARAVPALDGSAVLVVDEVIAPQPETAARDEARTALANDMRSDVLAQYEAALRQRYPVQVDQGQLASLMEAQAQ